jgi:kinesin family member 11
MRSGESASEDAISDVRTAVKDAGEAMKGSFNAWSVGLKKSCESLCSEVQTSGLRSAETVERALKAMAALLEVVIREAKEHVEQERNTAIQLGTLARDNANTEVSVADFRTRSL